MSPTRARSIALSFGKVRLAVEAFLPKSDEVKLFSFSLETDAEVVRRLESFLSADEVSRADRFLLPHLRRRYVVCRGVLREILGRATAQAANDIRFCYEQWGKPLLVNSLIPPLHFNVSHSQDRGLVALARSPLGVDLEVWHERLRPRSIVSQVLSQREQSAWETLPSNDRDATIMRLWVCKEALLKALGLGIAEGLQHISFPLPVPLQGSFFPDHLDPGLLLHLDEDGTCHRNAWVDARSWKVQLLHDIPAAFTALATHPSLVQVTWTEHSTRS